MKGRWLIISLESFGYTATQIEILREIYINPGITRKQLSEKTGISGRSIIKYVTDFLESKIIVHYETKKSTGGRKAISLAINPDFRYVLAVDIGSYAVKIGVVNMHGQIIKDEFIIKKEKKTNIPITPQEILERLEKFVEEFGKDRFAGVGISITGLVNNETNFIEFSPNIPNFNNVDVFKTFEVPLGLPVSLDTSARCLALAEQKYGLGKGIKNQIYISVGHSISAGIIINHHLFGGSNGAAGEIGHVCTGTDGIRCTCGNYDCLEIYSTLPTIVGNVAQKVNGFHGYSPTAKLITDDQPFTWEHVNKGLELKDKIVVEAIEDVGKRLGYAITHLISVLNPELIVFGGSVTELLPQVIDEAIITINNLGMISSIQKLKLLKSELGYKAAIMGSAAQVMNDFFKV